MESAEEMLARHRRESKDLQGKITNKKKQATKKTRKGVNTECEDLERALKAKHEDELAAAGTGLVPDSEDVPELDDDSVDEEASAQATPSSESIQGLTKHVQKSSILETADSESHEPRKRNRQKDRLARRAAEQEAAAVEAEKEAVKLPNWKRKERTAMLKAFKENHLVEKEIQPDGHCLFSAVADQLSQLGIPLGPESDAERTEGMRYRTVRKTAARYIEGHPDEFAGFLDEPLVIYAHKIRDTAEWGGQVELIALAKSYNVEICVLQDGRIDRLGPGTEDEKDVETIWLAYYHHGYGLGEHYNSLRKAP